MTLDTVSVSLRKEGIGTEVKHANVISMEDEDSMWEKGVIDTTSPWALIRAAFYTVGLHFSLRGGQEHRDFKVSQLSRVPLTGYDKSTHYVYVENGSINYQGRFSETGQRNKVVRAYAQPGSNRCPVLILDRYLSKLPPRCYPILYAATTKFANRSTETLVQECARWCEPSEKYNG